MRETDGRYGAAAPARDTSRVAVAAQSPSLGRSRCRGAVSPPRPSSSRIITIYISPFRSTDGDLFFVRPAGADVCARATNFVPRRLLRPHCHRHRTRRAAPTGYVEPVSVDGDNEHCDLRGVAVVVRTERTRVRGSHLGQCTRRVCTLVRRRSTNGRRLTCLLLCTTFFFSTSVFDAIPNNIECEY